MTKKIKLIIAGSTVLAGSVITATAVTLSKKANQSIPEQKQEDEQQIDSQKPNKPTPEQKQEQQNDDTKKTEEKNGQAETNEQQVDSQKDGDTQKQQDEAESGSGEKTEENNGQVDLQKDSTEEKQKDDAEAASGEKTEENSVQVETNKQEIDSHKDSTEEKQKDGAEAGSGEQTEKNNKTAEPMQSQVDSQTSNTQKQQNEVESTSDRKVVEAKTTETSEQKGIKLTPISLSFKNDKYFYLKLQTSKETFEKIKDDRLRFTLDKGNAETDEWASEFGHNGRNIYYLNFKNESNGNVSFEISSNLSYGGNNEKGTYKVTKVWSSKDSYQKNLLDKESNTVKVE